MNDTSFTIKWVPSETDGGAAIIEYIIEMKESTNKAWKKVGTTTKDCTYLQLTGLKKGTSYNFRIYARNEAGTSDAYIPDDKVTAGKLISNNTLLYDILAYYLNNVCFFFNSTTFMSSKSYGIRLYKQKCYINMGTSRKHRGNRTYRYHIYPQLIII